MELYEFLRLLRHYFPDHVTATKNGEIVTQNALDKLIRGKQSNGVLRKGVLETIQFFTTPTVGFTESFLERYTRANALDKVLDIAEDLETDSVEYFYLYIEKRYKVLQKQKELTEHETSQMETLRKCLEIIKLDNNRSFIIKT